jgi:C4-dicarboxylate-specific signal transduction histidine kinase
LLDSAAIFSGKLRVEQKTVAIESVVRAAVEIAEPLAAPKRLRINVQCDVQPTTLIGDSARLQQVVSNLLSLSNANMAAFAVSTTTNAAMLTDMSSETSCDPIEVNGAGPLASTRFGSTVKISIKRGVDSAFCTFHPFRVPP